MTMTNNSIPSRMPTIYPLGAWTLTKVIMVLAATVAALLFPFAASAANVEETLAERRAAIIEALDKPDGPKKIPNTWGPDDRRLTADCCRDLLINRALYDEINKRYREAYKDFRAALKKAWLRQRGRKGCDGPHRCGAARWSELLASDIAIWKRCGDRPVKLSGEFDLVRIEHE